MPRLNSTDRVAAGCALLLALLAALGIATTLSGCMWPTRIPVVERRDCADDGTVTNRVWVAPVRDMGTWTCYPLLGVRVAKTPELWRMMLDPISSDLKGEELYMARRYKRLAPVGLCVLWLGLPFDLVADTTCLPFDLYAIANRKETNATETDSQTQIIK
jgi:hypothetical protein